MRDAVEHARRRANVVRPDHATGSGARRCPRSRARRRRRVAASGRRRARGCSPLPTVPEPITSPGRSVVLRAACASSASQLWYIAPRLPRERSSPLTRATISPPAAVELVGRDEDRPERRREVLALRRPEPDAHLVPLQVARRPVVQDREAADPALGADHRGALELVVELAASRPGTARPRPARRSPPGSRSRRRGSRTTPAAPRAPRCRAGVRDVLLERHEVAHRRRVQHRRRADRRRRARTRRARAPTPPPVKNDCSVCAASWITRSPSIRPGQPRSSASSFGREHAELHAWN